MDNFDLIIKKFNIFEELTMQGFVIEIKMIDHKFVVRLSSPVDIVKLGYGDTLSEALFSALLYTIIHTQSELLNAEEKANGLEKYLHNKDVIYNAFDTEEIKRYEARKKQFTVNQSNINES